MKRFLILGAGGHGQVIADILSINAHFYDVELGFLDDNPNLEDQKIMGLPVYGPCSTLSSIPHDGTIVGLGDNRLRYSLLLDLASQGELLVNAIHPQACVSRYADLGNGCVICAGAVINTACQVGSGVIVNTCASVDHHNQLGVCCHVAPGAHTGGNVSMGDGVFVGIGACVLPGLALGAWATVGAGACVIQPVEPGIIVVGVPAHPV